MSVFVAAPVLGQQQSPVRLMCPQPTGKPWARTSAGVVTLAVSPFPPSP